MGIFTSQAIAVEAVSKTPRLGGCWRLQLSRIYLTSTASACFFLLFTVCSYNAQEDELRGTNVCLFANEDFSIVESVAIGPLEPDYGFSSVRGTLIRERGEHIIITGN